MTTFSTAAPHVLSLGTQDNSTAQQLANPIAGAPDHVPLVYLYTQKGPDEALVDGSRRTQLFGLDSFIEGSKYFTHQTYVSNMAAAGANLQKIRRVKPADAGPIANVTLYLDVCQKTVDSYVRNADGSIQRDAITGAAVLATPAASFAGYQIGIVAEVDSGPTADADFGTASIKTGTTVVGANTSQMYPLMSFQASSWGEVFNLCGVRFDTINPMEVQSKHTAQGQQLYQLMVSKKPNAITSSQLQKTIYASVAAQFSLDQNYKDPDTTASLSLDTAIKQWNNTTDLSIPYTVGDISKVHVYQSSINAVLNLLHAAEKTAVTTVFSSGIDSTMSDISSSIDRPFVINPFTAKSTTGVPYFAVQMANGVDGTVAPTGVISVGSATDIMLGGASDGTMDLANLETYAVTDIQNYLDANSIYQSPRLMEESVIYDSGFSFSNKLKLAAFMGAVSRKDTAVYLSNYVFGENSLTEAERIARTTTLSSVLRAYAESTYFGTGAMRGWIVDGAGVPRNFNYSGRLPLTLELLAKNCAVFSAENKVWNRSNIYDHYPSNRINNFSDLTSKFVPPATRNKLWNAGVTYAQAFSTTEEHFPMVRSIYSNDTSIITNSYAVWAAISLERLGFLAHATFTGAVRYTKLQFIEVVEKFCENATANRFAGLVEFKPRVVIDAGDEANGFSWHLELHFSANNGKTAMALSKHAYRAGQIPF